MRGRYVVLIMKNLGRRTGLGEGDAPDEDWKQLERCEQFLRG